jgi:hypothetical protein
MAISNCSTSPIPPHHDPPPKITSLPDRWLQGRFDDAAMITGVRMNTDRSLLIREY